MPRKTRIDAAGALHHIIARGIDRGKLFQDPTDLLELVRYIHLNPLRARFVGDLTALDKYSFNGHRVIMGRHSNDWQDTSSVLRLFCERLLRKK